MYSQLQWHYNVGYRRCMTSVVVFQSHEFRREKNAGQKSMSTQQKCTKNAYNCRNNVLFSAYLAQQMVLKKLDDYYFLFNDNSQLHTK